MQFGFYNPVVPDELELVSTPIGDRAQTGIPDLDSVIDGGFPRKSSVLISGGPGSGKTTMALQYLVNGVVLYNEPGVLISFEQTRESIIAVGRQFGWDIENLEKQHMLFIHEYTPEQLEKAISAGGGSLRDMVDSIKAKRFVLDSISEYLAMFPSELGKRKACTDFYRAVTKWGCTLIIIGEEDTDGTNRVSSVADYESDAVIRLYNERKGDIRLRSLEIFKMRDTRHAGRLFPMKMTSNGIIVRVKDPILASRQ
jgi:circadian clock protein KaiC